MYLADFDFDLPPELIAQQPPAERGQSRLLTLDRSSGALGDRRFVDLPTLLDPGDLLVVNDTKVFAARLLGRRLPGGGAAECLLLRRVEDAASDSRTEVWEALVHPGQRLKEGSRLEFGAGDHVIRAEVLNRKFQGRRTLRFETDGPSLTAAVDAIGHVPLPPYIKRPDFPADRERYQTVFAAVRGSVAAPTAGLHFTPALLAALDARGVERTTITLHVGYGTFQPVRVSMVEDHRMEAEYYDVSEAAAADINRTRARNGRVVAVGTTTTRTLESLPVDGEGNVQTGSGSTDLFIRPGHRFRVVSALITNFHLPQSSLLLLVSAFAGRDQVLDAYRHAVREGYRFYSYGDAMLIT
jgi:S-adenosylmethionine:tRNA ribosyltransferase-isomerase